MRREGGVSAISPFFSFVSRFLLHVLYATIFLLGWVPKSPLESLLTLLLYDIIRWFRGFGDGESTGGGSRRERPCPRSRVFG